MGKVEVGRAEIASFWDWVQEQINTAQYDHDEGSHVSPDIVPNEESKVGWVMIDSGNGIVGEDAELLEGEEWGWCFDAADHRKVYRDLGAAMDAVVADLAAYERIIAG